MGDRKVILIKGDSSNWYDEVIFIVKGNASVPQSPAAEAENIIKRYMAAKYKNGMSVKKITDRSNKNKRMIRKRNKRINKAVDICLILVLIALAVLVFITLL